MAVALAPEVRVEDGLAVVDFDRFDLDAYALFLRVKTLPESQIAYDWERDTYRVTTLARFAPMLNIDQQCEGKSRWFARQDGVAYIYALIDPLTNQVRYLGKSVDPGARLHGHCNDPSDTWRTHWIRTLAESDQRPILLLLERLGPDDDWQAIEKAWIAFGRERGWPLTNCTDGGDGVVNLPPDVRERIRKAWIGRKHRPETLAKIGAASRQRHPSPEQRARVREKMLGREFTPEWRERISHGLRKLTDEQVHEIRRLLADGLSQHVIAERFDVHQGTVSHIKRGTSYGDVV